ncbi:MAG: YjbQ family protein [Spirochaetales bacterium]|nr:YjbQ family protein [Spirochaetales bacterium]
MKSLDIRTSSRTDFVNITAQVRQCVSESGVNSGLVVVYVPHTTAGVTINEAADPDVVFDMTNYFDKLVPWNNNYRHGEGNSAAHIKTTMVGSSVSIPIENGKMALGVWQGIFFCDFDGPRNRQCYLTITFND